MSHVLKILWDRPLKTVNSDKIVKQQAKVSWENISLKPIYFGYFGIVYANWRKKAASAEHRYILVFKKSENNIFFGGPRQDFESLALNVV